MSIFKTGLIKNIGKVLTGNIVGQSVTIIAVPIISRLYSPDAIGVAAIILALSIVFGSFSTLRFNNAVLLPQDDVKASQLVTLCLMITVCISLVLSLLIIMLPKDVYRYISISPEFYQYLWFVPVLVFFIGCNEVVTAWCIRHKRFGSYSSATVSSSTVSASTKIILGKAGGGDSVFILWGTLLASITNTVVIVWDLRKIPPKLCSSLSNLKNIFIEYKDFPIYSSPTGLLNKTGKFLPTLMLGFLFSPAIVGFYVMANNVIQVPLTVVGNSIRKVFQQRSAELCANEKFELLRDEFIQITLYLFKLGLLPTLVLLLVGPWLLTFILGGNWSATGQYVQLLCPWFFMWFMTSPSMAMLISLRRQKFLLYYQLILIVFRVLALLIGQYSFNDALYSIALFSGVSAIGQCFLIFYTYYAINGHIEKRNVPADNKIKVCYYSPFYTSECEARHARMHDIWHYLYRMKVPPFSHENLANQGREIENNNVYFPPFRRLFGRYGKESYKFILWRQFYNALNTVWLSRKLNRQCYDVFHTIVLDSISSRLLKIAKQKNSRLKVIVGPNIMSPIRQNQQKVLALCNSPLIDKVLAVGEYHRSELIRMGVLQEKISLLPPTVDPEFFSVDDTIHLPLEPFKILFANKLSRKKGIDIFLQALELLKSETDISFQATIAGNGDYDISKHAEIKENIILSGFVPRSHMASYYHKHHIYVHSGSDEFGPTTIIEALACGRPCVLPEILSFSEYDRKKDCLYFKPNDAQSLKRQLVSYYEQLIHGRNKKDIHGLAHGESIEFLHQIYKEVTSIDD